MEGTFRVNTPPVLLGYHKRGRHSGAPGDLGIISRNDTLLTLFVTIEPPLQPSQPMAERVTLPSHSLIREIHKNNNTRENKRHYGTPREDGIREGFPVPHDNFLKSIKSV